MRREIAISIITTMVVITIFASSAAAVDVDGTEAAGEWDGALCVDDPYKDLPGAIPFDSGYDIKKFCVLYDPVGDTLYFKFDTYGVPGDADGDTDPNATAGGVIPDYFEVGSGELYRVLLDVDTDGVTDYRLEYNDNSVVMKHSPFGSGDIVSGVGDGSIGSWPYTDTVVEISFTPAHNMSGFGNCDANLTVEGYAGCFDDIYGEDKTSKIVNEPPVPVLSGTHVCYCTYTVFSSTGSYDPDGTIVLYEWDFDDRDGITTDAIGPTASYHYGAVDNYTVTLTVTDDFGFKCSNTTTVYVYENPTADFDAPPVYWCEATVFTDTSYGGTPPYTYEWDFENDSVIDNTTQNPTHHYPAPGDYIACLYVTDYYGCTDEICKPVHVEGNPPVPVPKARGIGCLEVEFNASESYDQNPNGSIVKYEWDLDNNGVYEYNMGNVPLLTHTFTAAQCGVRTIGLRVTNDAGVNNSTTAEIYVDCPPTAVCNVNDSSLPAPGGWVLFDGIGSTDENVSTLNYTWVIHGATYYGISVAYNVTNDTTAYLTVRDEYGCNDTCSKEVEVTYGKGDPHADANGPYKTCVGYSIIFDASGSWCNGCNIDWYEWDVDNNETNGYEIKTSEPIHEYTYPGEYRGIVRLRVTVDACGNTDTDTAYVIVEPCDPAAVPIMTPLGALALIGMLCIVGVGRIMKRSRRF